MAQMTLQVRDLCTSFFTDKGEIKAVNHVSFDVPKGSIIGIVGESGCGKSMTARSVMRLLKYPGKIVSGSITLEGKELTALTEAETLLPCNLPKWRLPLVNLPTCMPMYS